MKKLFTLAFCLSLVLSSCDLFKDPVAPDFNGNGSADPSSKWDLDNPTYEAEDEDHITINGIEYEREGKLYLDRDGEPAEVETDIETIFFSAFPRSKAEFAMLQDRFLGNDFAGAVVLEIMGMEMYRRDRTVGEECLKLANYSSNLLSLLNVLSQRFPKTRGGEVTDAYMQPYFVAALLDGSTIDNNYTPDEPYAVTVQWKKTENHQKGTGISFFGDVYYVSVSPGGYAKSGSPERWIGVMVDEEAAHYEIFSCSSIIAQVANIRNWTDNLK